MNKKITTADCKNWLVKKYPQTNFENWKRVSKYLDETIVTREFQHLDLTVILQEKDFVLFEKYNDLQIDKILQLNHDLHYLDDLNSTKLEFSKYLNYGTIFSELQSEFLNNDHYHYSFPYSLINSKIIDRVYDNIVKDFVFSIYEIYGGETSIEFSDVYGICGGDSGQTCGFLFDKSIGLISYLANNGIEVSGTSENTLSVETDNINKIIKIFNSFGLQKFNPKLNLAAYISQESI